MISGLYFQHTPAHLRPKDVRTEAQRNKAVRAADKLRSGVYAEAGEAQHFFKRKVLPKIEAARKRGDIVRFINGRWFINGSALEA